MPVSPLAGKPADAVDPGRRVQARHRVLHGAARSVRRRRSGWRSGRPGHRGSSFDDAFNEAHILAITQAICLYRKAEGDRRAALPRDRHPRAVGAGLRERARGARGKRRRGQGRRRRRLHADPRHLPRDPDAQPRPPRRAGRRDRRDAVAQSAALRRVQVQPAQRRPGRHGRHEVDRGPGQRLPGGRPAGRAAHALRARPQGVDDAAPRLPRCLRRRPRRRWWTWRP